MQINIHIYISYIIYYILYIIYIIYIHISATILSLPFSLPVYQAKAQAKHAKSSGIRSQKPANSTRRKKKSLAPRVGRTSCALPPVSRASAHRRPEGSRMAQKLELLTPAAS